MPETVVYLSGPITGIENFNKELFKTIKNKVESLGFTCIDTHDICEEDWSWNKCMKKSIQYMMKADIVFFIDGWQNSKGCKIENRLVVELGITHFYITENTDLEELLL